MILLDQANPKPDGIFGKDRLICAKDLFIEASPGAAQADHAGKDCDLSKGTMQNPTARQAPGLTQIKRAVGMMTIQLIFSHPPSARYALPFRSTNCQM